MSTQGAKRRGRKIGLIEVLLLGAPGGKTELLDGKVYRMFRGGAAREARVVFEQVARELCEIHGAAWRGRLIEGRNTFTSGGAEVRLRDDTVELEVGVSPELWRKFAF